MSPFFTSRKRIFVPNILQMLGHTHNLQPDNQNLNNDLVPFSFEAEGQPPTKIHLLNGVIDIANYSILRMILNRLICQ